MPHQAQLSAIELTKAAKNSLATRKLYIYANLPVLVRKTSYQSLSNDVFGRDRYLGNLILNSTKTLY